MVDWLEAAEAEDHHLSMDDDQVVLGMTVDVILVFSTRGLFVVHIPGCHFR